MKSYLNALRNHPGTGIATVFTLMGGLAGVGHGGLIGFIGGAAFAGLFCWIPVLITAYGMREKDGE